MKKTENMSARHMLFLEKVFERRDILFKKGTNTNGNIHAKEEEWEQIRRECVDAGYFELKDKTFRHLRDITWQNFRRRAVAKLELVRKGGKDVEQLTDCDKMVLAIIGNVQVPPVTSNSHLPTQVIVDEELEDCEPQVSGELFNMIKSEPIDILPMINSHSFASLFDTRSNTTQSESTDDQPIVIETENHQRSMSTRRPLFEDDEDTVTSPPLTNNNQSVSFMTKRENLKRKRQLADIRYRDAETERMLAEAEKLRAEAILIRLQANEIELKLKRMKNDHDGTSATALITDGEQL